MKCTFNINTGKHPKEGGRPNFTRDGAFIEKYTWSELADAYKGHEIASHSLDPSAP